VIRKKKRRKVGNSKSIYHRKPCVKEGDFMDMAKINMSCKKGRKKLQLWRDDVI